ncbi:MAG: hypothetical protein JWO62_1572 [Acidimicrobiaceae bacterium]|nr:hypothetical protein [Acidimicrobiaceae bacterium]
MSDEEHTRPDRATRDAERREAQAAAMPGRGPTPSEEEAADEFAASEDPAASDSVAEHYREMTERGSHQGEGRLP